MEMTLRVRECECIPTIIANQWPIEIPWGCVSFLDPLGFLDSAFWIDTLKLSIR